MLMCVCVYRDSGSDSPKEYLFKNKKEAIEAFKMLLKEKVSVF